MEAGGRLLFVSDLVGGAVSVIDVAAGRVITRFEAGEGAGALLTFAS